MSITSAENSCMPSPPEGPVPTRRMRRTSAGASSTNLLRDHATDRESEQIDLLQAERLDEGDEVGRDSRHRVQHLANRTTDTPIIDQDHRAVLRQPVGVDRIEIVPSCR